MPLHLGDRERLYLKKQNMMEVSDETKKQKEMKLVKMREEKKRGEERREGEERGEEEREERRVDYLVGINPRCLESILHKQSL